MKYTENYWAGTERPDNRPERRTQARYICIGDP